MSVSLTRPLLVAARLIVPLGLLVASPSAHAQRLVSNFAVSGELVGIVPDPDGRKLTCLVLDKRIDRLDLKTGRSRTLFEFHPRKDIGSFSNLLVSPRGNWLAAASLDTLVVLNRSSGRLKHIIVGPGRLLSIAASPSGDRVAGCGLEFNGFAIWDVATGRLLRRLGDRDSTSHPHLAWSPMKDLIATTGIGAVRETVITLWDAALGTRVGILPESDAWNSGPYFSPDGRRLVALLRNQTLVSWNVSTREVEWRYSANLPKPGLNYSLSFSPDGRFILATSGRELFLVDANSGQLVQRWDAQLDEDHSGASTFFPGGALVASAGVSGHMRLWDVSDIVNAWH